MGENSVGRTRNIRICLALILTSLVLAAVTFPILSQMPAGLIPDDGYFYSAIARHIAQDHFSSFDGIHPTDGYHQLWQYLLAAVAFVTEPFHLNRAATLISFLFLDLSLLLGAAWITGRTVWERLFILFGLAGCEFLMEGHLLAFLIATLSIGLISRGKGGAGLLIAAALIPLARIDSTVVALGLVFGVFLSGSRSLALKLLGCVLAGAALHFASMLLLHGHLWSVSSSIKSGASSGGLRLFANLGQRTPTLPVPFEPQGMFVVLLGITSLVLLCKSPKSKERSVLVGLWLGTAAFTSIHLCLSDVHPWYYAPALIGFPIVLIRSGDEARAKNFAIAGAAATLILVAALCAKTFSNRKEAGPVREFVEQVNGFDPGLEPIYMVDGSGYWGYWADAPVINGDGLVNSHEYAESLKKNSLGNYLSENRTSLIMTNKQLAPGEPLVNIGGLRVDQDKAEVVLTKADNGHYFFTNFILWKLKK